MREALKAGLQSIESLVDMQAVGYAGDVTPQQAYEALAVEGGQLVDVRTQPEWQFTGVPDLRAQGVPTHFISWKIYPHFEQNPHFIAELKQLVPDAGTPLFFLCRSGGRSRDAAMAAHEAGFEICFNIADGFEGEIDAAGKRGRHGWKGAELPWSQT